MKICYRDNGFVEIYVTEFVDKRFTYAICRELLNHLLKVSKIIEVEKPYYKWYKDMTPSEFQPYRREHFSMKYLYFSINVPNETVGAIIATSLLYKMKEIFSEKS